MEPSRISGISFETMPVVPEVSFEAPFPLVILHSATSILESFSLTRISEEMQSRHPYDYLDSSIMIIFQRLRIWQT